MNSEDPATPWVEVALITLIASEKVIGHGNTVQQAHTHTRIHDQTSLYYLYE